MLLCVASLGTVTGTGLVHTSCNESINRKLSGRVDLNHTDQKRGASESACNPKWLRRFRRLWRIVVRPKWSRVSSFKSRKNRNGFGFSTHVGMGVGIPSPPGHARRDPRSDTTKKRKQLGNRKNCSLPSGSFADRWSGLPILRDSCKPDLGATAPHRTLVKLWAIQS